jgi:3-oxoacyl-[acyl-carrier protein] reductase
LNEFEWRLLVLKRFEQKSVIVTGGSKGIGKAIAKLFAAEGANVLIASRQEDRGNQTVQEIKQAGGEASFIKTDVTSQEQVEAMTHFAVQRYGKLDVVCNNAGSFPPCSLETMTEENWEQIQAVNLKGSFLVVKACLPQLKEAQQGRIILISSITGPHTGSPGYAHYGAAKSGLLGFMRTAAVEIAKYNITINAVLPGNIYTEALDALGEEYLQNMIGAIPIGRFGRPEDISDAVLFLASEQASFITGQTLVVDGGQILPESREVITT